MKIKIEMSKKEFEKYKDYAVECGWGDDVEACIKESLIDESGEYIMGADIVLYDIYAVD